MDTNDLKNRFEYHPPKDDETRLAHELVRETMLRAAQIIAEKVPDGRELSLAVTKLEEAMMWANAGIARDSGVKFGVSETGIPGTPISPTQVFRTEGP